MSDKMNLYILEATLGAPAFNPWYDKTFAQLIFAKNEDEARKIATEESGDEGDHVWGDATQTTCAILTTPTEPKVVIVDRRAS